jgi:hypothetical protein
MDAQLVEDPDWGAHQLFYPTYLAGMVEVNCS